MIVTATHIWDTRPRYARWWPGNLDIYRHNMKELHKNLPDDWEIRHRIHINTVNPCPALLEFAEEELPEQYDVQTTCWHRELDNYGGAHLTAMNKVMWNAYQVFAKDIEAADLIFCLSQDWVIANHHDESLLVVMHDLMDRNPRNEALGWYDQWGLDHYDYVSHSVRPWASKRRYTHNGAWLYKRRKLDLVRESIKQTGHAYECWLGKRLKERCVYMKPDGKTYFFITNRNCGGDEVLAKLRDPDRIEELYRWHGQKDPNAEL